MYVQFLPVTNVCIELYSTSLIIYAQSLSVVCSNFSYSAWGTGWLKELGSWIT